MSRLVLFLTVSVLLLPIAARADDIWVWTDAAGEAHYTNDPASIPERNRKSARPLGGEKGADSKNQPEVTVLGKGAPKEKEKEPVEPNVGQLPPPPEAIETAVRPPGEDEKASEQEWRTLFRKANDRVRKTERQVQRSREALSKMPSSDYTVYDYAGNLVADTRAQALKLQLDEEQRSLDDAREQLHDLERAAAREAIPLEWRR